MQFAFVVTNIELKTFSLLAPTEPASNFGPPALWFGLGWFSRSHFDGLDGFFALAVFQEQQALGEILFPLQDNRFGGWPRQALLEAVQSWHPSRELDRLFRLAFA